MANIMLTDICNLKCPYCFANEFVNKNANEITEENFDKAVDFILADKSVNSIGLIGGEPTLHSQFPLLVQKLIDNESIERIILFTNGIFLDKYFDILCNKKINFLINCNSGKNISFSDYERMLNNIDCLVNQYHMSDNVTLGINLYKPDIDYSYIIDLLNQYNFKRVRASITVPNMDKINNMDALTYFMSMKKCVLGFLSKLFDNGIAPIFDCNKMPFCIIDTTEYSKLVSHISERDKDYIYESNFWDKKVTCSPVIDILQDLTAVRCFGLSEYSKQNINNYKTLTELNNFYIQSVDSISDSISNSPECVDCQSRINKSCAGGCLVFKIQK